MQEQKPLGWAIVGLGRLSLNQILPAFASAEMQGAKITALVSGDRGKAEQVAAKYGVPTKNLYDYTTFDRIVDNKDVDVVYIVLPNGMHAEYTIRAFRAGKHVLCEKPMANTASECRQMIAAGKKASRKLMVAYRVRYEPYNREAIRVCRSGEIGAVRSVIADHGFNIGARYRVMGKERAEWRLDRKLAGGGSLMDIGIYSLNATRYLTGEEPVSLTAMESTPKSDPRFKEVEDTLHFTLRFPSGALANCTSSYGYAGANRIRVIGTKGGLDLEPATAYGGLNLTVFGKDDVPKKFEQKSHFALEMAHFNDCIRSDKAPLTGGQEGLRDLTIMEKIYQAARTGGTVTLTS